MDDRDIIARRRMEEKERSQMNNLTPEQLQQAGLEAVPWETLEDVKLDAWYAWNVDDYRSGQLYYNRSGGARYRIVHVDHKCNAISLGDGLKISLHHLVDCFKHTTDNGKTWQPCHNIRPVGGRIEHEKLAVGGEVINKEWEGK